MDINYELGVIKAQNEALHKTVNELVDKVEGIENQLLTWKSTAYGAIFVLSLIGSVILWLSDTLIGFIKIKLGM